MHKNFFEMSMIALGAAAGAVGGGTVPTGNDWVGLLVAVLIGVTLRTGRLLQNRRFKYYDRAIGELIVTAGGCMAAIILWRYTPAVNGLSHPNAPELEWLVSLVAAFVGADVIFARIWKETEAKEEKPK